MIIELDLINEASLFFNISREEVLEKIKTNPQRAVDDWNNKKSMEDFYRTTDVYVFGLIEFNCQERLDNLRHPIKMFKGAKILDYGAGMGILDIVLAGHNNVDYYDVDSVTKDFAKYLIKKTDSKVRFIEEEEINKNKYDVIITADVLEHLVKPMDTLYMLHERLNKSGLMFTTGLDFSIGDNTPMHLIENLEYRKELKDFFIKNYNLMFYHQTRFETIYLWKKK